MQVAAEPLTTAAFAAFGTVIPAMTSPGRAFCNESLGNARASAKFDLSLALIKPLHGSVLRATVMERHRYSSQTFLPLRVARYLIVVAPQNAEGTPDVTRVRAFIAEGNQGVTYRMDTWHHGITALDEPGEFAVLMWCDGSDGDEEFRTIDQPFTVVLA